MNVTSLYRPYNIVRGTYKGKISADIYKNDVLITQFYHPISFNACLKAATAYIKNNKYELELKYQRKLNEK